MVYFAALVLMSGGVQATIIARGGKIGEHVALVIALMWSPTVAMILARLICREGIRDVSFRPGVREGGWREYLLAWLYPVAVGLAAYGLAWASGLAPFAVPEGGLYEGFAAAAGPIGAVAGAIGLNLTLGMVLSAISAAGEEFGWRGYMLTRLIDAGVKRPVLVSGLVWGLWHAPLILSGQYAAGPYPVASSLLFLVGITATGYVFARVRLATGSVWPAVILHSAWNAVIQGAFDAFLPGHDAAHAGSIWVGESGVLVVATQVLFALALAWRAVPYRRSPSDHEGRLELRAA